nr:PREDICTED: uncharacterized protein LOC105671530 isoform X2 [Linepithema humile]
MCPQIKYRLLLNWTLNTHFVNTHLDKLENVQETLDIIPALKCDSKVAEIKENMWEYYNNIQDQVNCKFCEYNCFYIHSTSNFREHTHDWHTKIHDWEIEHKRQIWPFAYFMYCYQYIGDKEIMYSKCLICRDVFAFNDKLAETHLKNLHSEDIKRFSIYAPKNWIFKYCYQKGDKIKCNICYKNTSIQVLSAPLNHIIEEHSDILQWNMTQKLWQNFINLRNFQAGCRFCNFQSYYIDTTNFIKHVKEEHINAYNYEEANGEEWPFKFFNYYNSIEVQCALCSVIHGSTDKSNLIKHMCEKHFSEQPDNFLDYGWIWKYCTKYFNRHIEDRHPNRLTSTQRTYDIAGPSGSQPN